MPTAAVSPCDLHPVGLPERRASDQSQRSLPSRLSNVAGFQAGHVVAREDLVEQGLAPQAADMRMVQQNIEDTFMIHFSLWICIFVVLLCVLIPVQLGLFIWLAFTFVQEGHKCHGPLRWWAVVVLSFMLFNTTCNRKDEHGSCAHRIFCCFRQDPAQPKPQPLRVWTFDFLVRVLLPFVWNCMGIHWVNVDYKTERPCGVPASGFFLAAKVYSIFVLICSLMAFLSMLGLATLFRFIMRHGLLHTSHAAGPSVIEACKAIPFSEMDLVEHPSCCICTEDYDEKLPIVLTACGHDYHKVCLGNWLKVERTCPLCRKDLTVSTE